jgi:hypothetical protein
MLKIGTIVSIVSAVESLMGLVVPVSRISSITGYETPGVTYVLITTAGEFQGSIYPFQYHQLETISEPS